MLILGDRSKKYFNFVVFSLLVGFSFLILGCPAKNNPSSPSNPTAPTSTSTFTATNTVCTDISGHTCTPTFTATPSNTATITPTSSPTNSATNTASPTVTNTQTNSATATYTLTPTNTGTFTATGTPTNSATNTSTPTITNSPTNSATTTSTNTVTNTPTPYWHSIGGAGGTITFYSNTLYLGTESSSQLYVENYNGSSWTTIGGLTGYSTTDNSFSFLMFNGVPYFAFPDGSLVTSGNAFCFPPVSLINYNSGSINGTYWQYFTSNSAFNGSSSVNSGGDAPAIISDSGNIWLAYNPYVNPGGGTGSNCSQQGTILYEYTGGSWSNISTFTSSVVSPGLCSNGSGNIYVGVGLASSASVYSYNGATTVQIGSSLTSVTPYGLTLCYSNGSLYLGYGGYGGNGTKATVLKYSGGSWSLVGSSGFSIGEADNFTMTVYNGTPYVGYFDAGIVDGKNFVVQSFNGTTWASLGNPGINGCTGGCPIYPSPSICVNNGVPYISVNGSVLSGVWYYQ